MCIGLRGPGWLPGQRRLGLEFRLPEGRKLTRARLRIEDREKTQMGDGAVQLAFDEQTLLARQTLSVYLKY